MNAPDKPMLPPRVRSVGLRLLSAAASLGAGLAAALVLHYLLYRIGIPGTPFIYVVF